MMNTPLFKSKKCRNCCGRGIVPNCLVATASPNAKRCDNCKKVNAIELKSNQFFIANETFSINNSIRAFMHPICRYNQSFTKKSVEKEDVIVVADYKNQPDNIKKMVEQIKSQKLTRISRNIIVTFYKNYYYYCYSDEMANISNKRATSSGSDESNESNEIKGYNNDSKKVGNKRSKTLASPLPPPPPPSYPPPPPPPPFLLAPPASFFAYPYSAYVPYPPQPLPFSPPFFQSQQPRTIELSEQVKRSICEFLRHKKAMSPFAIVSNIELYQSFLNQNRLTENEINLSAFDDFLYPKFDFQFRQVASETIRHFETIRYYEMELLNLLRL